MMIMYFIIILLIFIIFLIISKMLTEVNMLSKYNYILLYECGYDLIYWFHFKISIPFIKICMIFILFEMEIMLLILMVNNMKLFYLTFIMLTFILMTLYMEIYSMNLNWLL